MLDDSAFNTSYIGTCIRTKEHRIRRGLKATARRTTICRDTGDRRDIPARLTATEQVNAPRVPLLPRFHVLRHGDTKQRLCRLKRSREAGRKSQNKVIVAPLSPFSYNHPPPCFFFSFLSFRSAFSLRGILEISCGIRESSVLAAS